MELCAAVMTGPGVGAIATIELSGASAQAVLVTVCKPLSRGDSSFDVGRIILGHFVDGDEIIDQVTVGCEAPQQFAIHCHGNPLIVAAIMRRLRSLGVKLLTSAQLRAETLRAVVPDNAIAIETKLALTTVKTVEGARLLAGQTERGLGRLCRQWRDGAMSLDEIKAQAAQVLRDSDIAQLIISGGTIVLVGPPNSGKSTLLNALAGREKAIVSEIAGTTRDWVSAEIHIPPLAATLIDTAGLAADLADAVDRAAQNRSVGLLDRADLVLLVLDAGQPTLNLQETVLDQLTGRRILPVLNKTDLLIPLDSAGLPATFGDPVHISAQQGTGLDTLIAAITRILGVDTFDRHTPVAFTDRQRLMLERLIGIDTVVDSAGAIIEILHGPV